GAVSTKTLSFKVKITFPLTVSLTLAGPSILSPSILSLFSVELVSFISLLSTCSVLFSVVVEQAVKKNTVNIVKILFIYVSSFKMGYNGSWLGVRAGISARNFSRERQPA